jgi:biotin carboxyl carrier protein
MIRFTYDKRQAGGKLLVKEREQPNYQPHEESVNQEMPLSSVASSLGGMFLKEHVANGGTVEIPSLGIILSQEDLKREPSGQEQTVFQRGQSEMQDEAAFIQPSTATTIASTLAGMLLEESIRKGHAVEIPSLGITLDNSNLRDPHR